MIDWIVVIGSKEFGVENKVVYAFEPNSKDSKFLKTSSKEFENRGTLDMGEINNAGNTKYR